jgi:hypothetical protein
VTCAVYGPTEPGFAPLEPVVPFGPNPASRWAFTADFERGVDSFIRDAVLCFDQTELRSAGRELASIWDTIADERRDPTMSHHRILEALLGYDRGCAPEAAMSLLAGVVEQAGFASASEIAAACANEDAVELLHQAGIGAPGLTTGIAGRIVCDSFGPDNTVGNLTGQDPWYAGVQMAREFRKAHGIPVGPVSDNILGDLLGLSREDLFGKRIRPSGIPFALARCNSAHEQTWFMFCSEGRLHRRYEAARLLAAANLLGSGDVLVASEARTARQIAPVCLR